MYLVIRKNAIIIALCIILAAVPAALYLTRDQAAAGPRDNHDAGVSDEGMLTASDTVNWGLSFQKEGATPVGNATSEYLAQYDSWYCGGEAEKALYLTFDAGYENGYTDKILDVLKKHQVPATFFLVGNYLEKAPELVKRMVEEGHIVGNHTYHHPDMAAISDKAAFEQELVSLEEKFKEITGAEMSRYYRPPQGKFSESNLKMAQELGYKTVFWSLAYVDWYQDNQPTSQEAFNKLIPRVHPGAVILLHSTSETNANILDDLLTKWEEMGYTFATLDQLTGA